MANRMISNNVLSILLIFAIFLSVLSTFSGLSNFGVTGFATNTTEVNLTVSETVDISVPIRAVDLGGDLSISTMNWTDNISNWKPQSFRIRNEGSVLVNITLQATQLFDTQASASAYYNYSANNYTAEANCSDATGACATTACCFSGNMPIGSALNLTHLLNFTTDQDEIIWDVGVQVPPGEASGAKGSVITLTSAASNG